MNRHLSRMGKTAVLGSLALFAGCVSTPQVEVPFALEKRDERAKVKLETSARIVVVQQVKSDLKLCEKSMEKFRAKIKNVKAEKYLDTLVSCSDRGTMTISTKDLQPKGLYMVEVKLEPSDTFVDLPTVAVRYPDPDFKSGPDQLPTGAKELAANQALKGAANYSAGQTTTWMRLKGKKTTVGLTFLEEGEDRQLLAQVYALPENAKTPRFVTSLVPKKRKDFKLTDDNLFVKITAKDYSGERKFSLIRTDAKAGAKSVRVPVIDLYQVDDTSSVVLLKASDLIKIDMEVAVFGKKATGETVALGKCTVTSLSEAQASCRLDQAKPANVIEYRAEVKQEGQAS